MASSSKAVMAIVEIEIVSAARKALMLDDITNIDEPACRQVGMNLTAAVEDEIEVVELLHGTGANGNLLAMHAKSSGSLRIPMPG